MHHVPRQCEEYWLPTPFASFLSTSPPVRHRVPSHFNWTLHTTEWLRFIMTVQIRNVDWKEWKIRAQAIRDRRTGTEVYNVGWRNEMLADSKGMKSQMMRRERTSGWWVAFPSVYSACSAVSHKFIQCLNLSVRSQTLFHNVVKPSSIYVYHLL